MKSDVKADEQQVLMYFVLHHTSIWSTSLLQIELKRTFTVLNSEIL